MFVSFWLIKLDLFSSPRTLCAGQQGDEHAQLVAVPPLLGGPTKGAPPGCPPAEPLHEGKHHYPLQDVLPRPSEPVHLQGEWNSLKLKIRKTNI